MGRSQRSLLGTKSVVVIHMCSQVGFYSAINFEDAHFSVEYAIQ